VVEPVNPDAARTRIAGGLEGAAQRGKLTEGVAAVLRNADAAIDPRAVLATNASSLSVTELAAVLDRPDRFLGMHFFSPVPASKLVEIVVAPATADDLVAAVRGWVERIGRTGIVVRDSPGFASFRLGVLLGLEAIRMLEEGVAHAEAIDTAMELGYRHPMGPLRSTDLVASTSGWPSPNTCTARSASASPHLSCCATRSSPASWAARPAAVSPTTGDPGRALRPARRRAPRGRAWPRRSAGRRA